MKKSITTALATLITVYGYSQYLPLAGGTLSGQLTINVPPNNGGTVNIRPSAGDHGYITFTENAVADRWAIGVSPADGNFYWRVPYPTSTPVMSLGTNGNLNLAGSIIGSTAMFNSGGNHTMEAISNQRYILQLRNASNAFNPSYGWWLGQDDSGKFMVHLAGNGDKFTIEPSGNATFNAQGSANSGSINIVSPDSFLRLNSINGTNDKQKWDLRAISASGYEGLEFRTINDANNVFSSKMFINHNGNIGIGTNSPTNYGVNTTTLSIANPIGGSFLDFYNAGLRTGHIYTSGKKFSINTVVLPDEVFPDLELGTVGGVNMTLKPFGNVGIGTASPQHLLHVQNSAVGSNIARFASGGPGGGTRGVTIYSNDSYVKFQVSDNTGNIGNWANLTLNPDGGNVAIGTTNPQGYKLAVAGNVIAESVKVALQGSWPDYVFKQGNKLLSLPEVEKYVQENNRLPEIPSEAEIKKNGIDLGQMDAKLLRKIEELTLYVIEQNKESMELRKMLEAQSKLVQQQNERIGTLEKQIKK